MYAKRGRSVDNKYPFPGFSLSSSLGVCASAELMWGEKSLGHPHHPYDYLDIWIITISGNCFCIQIVPRLCLLIRYLVSLRVKGFEWVEWRMEVSCCNYHYHLYYEI